MRCRWAGSNPRWRPATGLGGLTRAGSSQLSLLDPSDLEAETERMSFFLWTSEKMFSLNISGKWHFGFNCTGDFISHFWDKFSGEPTPL